ncbi:hypothetical protein D3C87_687230 [compost metagenome]
MYKIILSFFFYFVVFKRQFLALNVENLGFQFPKQGFKIKSIPSSMFCSQR